MKVISTIAIYARKSKFTSKGESNENQIKLCKEYAYSYFQVDEIIVYEDEGYSGRNTERPKFKEMLNSTNINKFDVLICYRLDRISRNIADFTSLIEILQNKNIDFVSIKEQFDTSTPMGRAMMYISSVFSQLERETIAERIKDNMYALARTGRWLGGKTPTGYTSKQISYTDKDGINRKMYALTSVEKELNLVKMIYNKYLELGSLTKLETWTLEKNIKTKSNRYFDKGILKIILSNPVYAMADKKIYKYFQSYNSDIANNIDDFKGTHGLMVFNKHKEEKGTVYRKKKNNWIIAIGNHKGIIPSNTWIKVQHQLDMNSKKAPRSGTSEIGLLSPLLICKNCGSKMRIITSRKNNKLYYYYKCILKEKSKGYKCNIKNLNGKLADKYVLNKITELDYIDIDIYKYLYNMKARIIDPYSKTKLQKEKLLLELEKHKKSVNNLTLHLANNTDSKASKYIIERIEMFDKMIKNIESEIKNIEKEYENITKENDIIYKLLLLIKSFPDNVDKLEFKEKKKLLHKVIYNIVWDGEKIHIKI
ncbi:recombinase family protein [Senegalia massiliensis]|uniref:Recombinase family protein n=1 Tax=Senegalia massiliensis TaxID=1720316 RepID=A0A845QXJ9_9CLOT|nr:recombinase family protein [Senegalia massiliensis]